MNRLIIGERDKRVLYLLWQFKLATTAIIAARVFQKTSHEGAYIRLRRLASAGYIKSLYPQSGRHHFWCLTDMGYELISKGLPALVQDGYLSENLRHDFLVAVAHLGGWLQGEPENVRLFTEQELRRIDPTQFPKAIPKSKAHRPDGYWIVNLGTNQTLLALEVELSQKSLDIYASVGQFYHEIALVEQVFWIVMTIGQGKSMLNQFRKVVFEGADVHSFILLSDFLKSNWQTKIAIGKSQGQSIQTVLDHMATTRRPNVVDFDFADTRKCLRKSTIRRRPESLLDFN